MKNRDLKNITEHAARSEKSIESYLTDQARERGMLCLKYSNPNMAGFPDRLLVIPGGRVVWVELKSKGRRPDKRQLIRHQELAGLGHRVHVVDNKAEVDNILNSISHDL